MSSKPEKTRENYKPKAKARNNRKERQWRCLDNIAYK